MSRKHRKTVSIVVALAFLLTLVLPMGAALAAGSATIATQDGQPLTEDNLNGRVIVLTLKDNSFADSTLVTTNFTVGTNPDAIGLSVDQVQYVSPTQALITLKYDGTDFDRDQTLTITVKKDELVYNAADVTSSGLTIGAIVEPLSISVQDDGSLVEAQENGEKLYVSVQGDTFNAANVDATNITVTGLPTGVTAGTPTLNAATGKVEIPLTGNASMDYDQDIVATVTVKRAALTTNTTGDDLTATYTFKAIKEAITVVDDGTIAEGSEDGGVLKVLLSGDTFVGSLPSNSITVAGLPPGVQVESVERVSDTRVNIVLFGNATQAYPAGGYTATVTVKAGALARTPDTAEGDVTATYTFKPAPAPPPVSDLDKYANGFSYGYKYVTPGENKEAGWAAIRLPEDPDVPRYADKLVVSVTLPEGALFMAPAKDATLDDYVQVVPAGAADVELVSASRSQLEVELTNMDSPLNLAVVFNFNAEDTSALEIDSDLSGDLKVTMDYVGFDGSQTVFSGSEDLLIARVAADEVTVSAASAKTVAIGSEREAAKITIAEGSAGTLEGATVTLEIVSDGASFNAVTAEKITSARYEEVDPTDVDFDEGDTVLSFEVGAQTIGLPGKVEITPYLDVTPDADDEIQIQVKVEKDDDQLASETVTVAKVTQAVSFAVTDVANTGGKITAGHDAKVLKESGDAAELTIKPVGSKYLPDALVYVEISGAKFDPDTPFEVSNGAEVKTYKDNSAAYFALDADDMDDEVTLSDFMVSANGEAAAGDIVLKFSSNAGSFEPAEVKIGQVVKPFEVSASAAPEIAYLSQGQAAGDIVIKETGKGAIIDNFKLVLPDGVAFATKPKVDVTAGNIDVEASLEDDDHALLVKVTDTSSVASTITISGISYDVNRLALDGDVVVKIVGVDDSSYKGWAEKVLAKVVNAKVVSKEAAAAPAPTKREASFVIGSTTYKVNGEEKTMDVAPYIDAASGRTYLPVRYVAYALGVSEDNIFYSNGQVSLLKDGRAVQMTIGSKSLVVNGVSITMDAAPVIKDGRTMLPFRWIATALGASVQWDEATKTVTMTIE